jgi:hypothetical protein
MKWHDRDFSPQQRGVIELAVADGIGRPPTTFEYRRIRQAANEYRLFVECDDTNVKARYEKRKLGWLAAKKLTLDLKAVLEALNSLYAEVPKEVTRALPIIQRLHEVAGEPPAIDHRAPTPEQHLYRILFAIWVDILGAKLSYITNGEQISGPCIQFFRAITEPLMGRAAPKPAYIKRMITNERRRRSDRSAAEVSVNQRVVRRRT